MTFEIKYDRDGQPIKQAQSPQLEALVQLEQPVIDKTSTIEEAAAVDTLEASHEDSQVQQEPIIEAPKPKQPAQSWAELRAQKDQIERERDEAMRILRQIEAQRNQPSSSAKATEDTASEPQELLLKDDEVVEAKHVKQLANELKKVRDEINNYKQQSTDMSAETKLKIQYPDFDKVVNQDNLNSLREAEPEIAASLHYNPDLYVKAVAAYKAIRKAGIYVEDTFMSEKQVAHKNAAKPRPVSSLSPQQGESPLTKANAFAQGLTPDLQKQLLKEMNDARKNL